MTRKINVYQTWDGEDMALSDAWFAKLNEARQHIHDNYGVPMSQMKLDAEGNWDGEAESGYDVHISRHEIEMTGDDICYALTNYPNR